MNGPRTWTVYLHNFLRNVESLTLHLPERAQLIAIHDYLPHHVHHRDQKSWNPEQPGEQQYRLDVVPGHDCFTHGYLGLSAAPRRYQFLCADRPLCPASLTERGVWPIHRNWNTG